MPIFASVFVWLLNLNFALAQIVVPDKPGGEGGDGDLITWVVNILKYLIGLAGIVAVAVLIMNAFMYITASGDEGKVQKATKGITYAIIGLIIAAISFLVINFVIDSITESQNAGGASAIVLTV